ncbi:HipA-like protein [Saprospira grandis DSM 2844]|uniref:HipA-like protein n=1 Tax=Saprospira grandis DSM 2844 TaxID=694433 RepID=J0P797_9BACT|nr:HipA domain-containing protein [Saprospira grandis]EJF53382.1 HipA-like protein [Saprospira grandis DSM 2844]
MFRRCLCCLGPLKARDVDYDKRCLDVLFDGQPLVNRINLARSAPSTAKLLSISGVQEKKAIVLDGGILRLAQKGELSHFFAKPIGLSEHKKMTLMPANEHLSMQLAWQVFGIEVATNALIRVGEGDFAYLCKRYDLIGEQRLKQEDFAALLGKTSATDGTSYKYKGSYLELFEVLREVPTYKIESRKLFELIVFNYLISNGDAHLKNFALLERQTGDYGLSPAFDLLNTRLHIEDKTFALDGLLPAELSKGKVKAQFYKLADLAALPISWVNRCFKRFLSEGVNQRVEALVNSSFLDEKTKRQYIQLFQSRRNKLLR